MNRPTAHTAPQPLATPEGQAPLPGRALAEPRSLPESGRAGAAPERTGPRRSPPAVRDLRGGAGRGVRALCFGPGDLVVVSGLPGGGKSTLMRRTVRGIRIDSQDTRPRGNGA